MDDLPTIAFSTTLYSIDGWVILHVPENASKELPSRGQVMVKGVINNTPFTAPLEPDGRWSHWLHIDDSLEKAIHATTGDTVSVALSPIKEWSEPNVPDDISTALAAHPQAHALWNTVTPLAHWEWVRWIRSTNSEATRRHRIEVACSKLEAGERRPCCWNRNLSTEPLVSKSGILREPTV